ncbi:unnamed protein product [Boreogadus saida]
MLSPTRWTLNPYLLRGSSEGPSLSPEVRPTEALAEQKGVLNLWRSAWLRHFSPEPGDVKQRDWRLQARRADTEATVGLGSQVRHCVCGA